jgi:AraC-like DNA-binding protein
MEASRNSDISNIRVEVWAAHRHCWSAGQKYHHDPSHHRNPALQCQLWLIQEGSLEVNSPGNKWRVEKDDAFLLPVTLERDILTRKPAIWLSLRLWITVFNRFNLLQNIALPAQWRPEAAEKMRLESWMEQIVGDYHVEAPHRRLVISGLAQAVLGLCWPHLSSVPLDSAVHAPLPHWLAHTLRSMAENPAPGISDFAHEAGISPAQFRRAFHQRIGMTPREYLKAKRLEAARHFLEHTDLSLRAIAARVGLRDMTHFSRTFKSTFDLTPSQYRASLAGDYEKSN